MSWQSINFDWNRARAFLVTAEEGSFSAAARALGMTQSTLGRQVAALEQELGVALFEKVGRGLQITLSGLALLEHAKEMGEAASKLSLVATGKVTDLEGTVSITAAEAAAVLLLPPLLTTLRTQEPGIRIEIIASNESSDLRLREADIAIRNVAPTQGDLIARKLPTMRASFYAAQSYLDSIGNPQTAADLINAHFVGFVDNAAYKTGLGEIGLALNETNFPYSTESHMTHWQLVKLGAAIGVMPDYLGNQEPMVRKVSPQIPSFELETWLVVHRELRSNRRIQVVYNFLADRLTELFSESQGSI
ncbi:MAG: LysR family transcriptional regulator [Pseudomonadota bacterium]